MLRVPRAGARKALGVLPLLVLLTASGSLAQQFDDDYEYGNDFYNQDDGFGDDGGAGGAGAGGAGGLGGADDDLYYDEYGYYGDEDDQYYEYYGYYTDDGTGYGDYYTDEYDFVEECAVDATSGKPVLSNHTAACDIKISGVDTTADRLQGGLDGVYKLTGCYNGKAQYLRAKSPAGEERVLWYSNTFGDWDVSKGTEPNENEILMYGGEMEHASVPLFVHNWHLGADLKSGTSMDEADYLPISVKVACADGKKFDPKEYNAAPAGRITGPLINDQEIEMKYKELYGKYAHADPSPAINFTFVVLLVMTGLTIVLAIPYFLMRKRGPGGGKGGKGDAGLATSFAQMLQASKKKQSGHIN